MKQRFIKRDNTRYGKRHKPGVMNQTETIYANELEAMKLSGVIIRWEFEGITFKIAEGCRYTPDFAVWLADGTMVFVDVKGGGPMDDKSRVKVKCVAEKFPMFTFQIAKRKAKKDGGGWAMEEF